MGHRKCGAECRPPAQGRFDLKVPSKGIEPVFHIGQPIAASGSADDKAASIVGDLDGELITVLPYAHTALEACAYF